MTSRQGGYRKPQRPAAVSTPQSGARTDGGPGDKQPMRVASGGAYGERKAAEEQQAGAPMAGGGPSAPSVAPQGGAGGAAPAPEGDMFRPSEVPGGPVGSDTAGSPAQILKENPQLALRTMYSMYPTPAIAALLRRLGTNG